MTIQDTAQDDNYFSGGCLARIFPVSPRVSSFQAVNDNNPSGSSTTANNRALANEGKYDKKAKKDDTRWCLLEIVGATGLSAVVSTVSSEEKANDDDVSSHVRVECVNTTKNNVLNNSFHCTKTIVSDANPIWTVQTKSLCVLRLQGPQIDAQQSTPVLRFFVVCSYHSKRHVGYVSLPARRMMNLLDEEKDTGKRIELSLLKGNEAEHREASATDARLAIRMRPTTAHDLEFMGISITAYRTAVAPSLSASPSCTLQVVPSSTNSLYATGGRNKHRSDKGKKPHRRDLGLGISSSNVPPLRGCPTDIEFQEVKFRSVFQSYRKKVTSSQRDDDPTGKSSKMDVFRVSVPKHVPHGKPVDASTVNGKEGAIMEKRWLTQRDLDNLSTLPSQHWVNVGGRGDDDRSVGRVYVEILGCDDLPQMDEIQASSSWSSVETDPFCALVMEDKFVRTDMMWDNAQHPRWMPWTMRAFCFHVQHPATALLRVAVFDYDQQVVANPLDAHDPIGRVAIDITSGGYLPDTNYVLTYRLQHDLSAATPPTMASLSLSESASTADSVASKPLKHANHPDRGTITIRLRVEWTGGERAVRMRLNTPPPQFVINCQTTQAQRVLRYTTRGPVDLDRPSVESIKLYVEEIKSFWKRYCIFLDILFETLLWRGRWHWSRGASTHVYQSRSVWFPMSSFVLFFAVAMIIERPHLLPTILLYSIAWTMMTIRYHASLHPYPWKRLRQPVLLEIASKRNHDDGLGTRIPACEGYEEGRLYDKLAQERGERMSALIIATLNFLSKASSIYSSSSIASDKFYSSARSVSWNTWIVGAGRLSPVHSMVKSICTLGRLYLSLINWTSYHAAYKLTTTCVLLGTVWALSPVRTLVVWIVRIVAWSLLGPWMRIVDLVWVHPWYPTTDELFAQMVLHEDSSARSEGGVSATASDERKLPDFEALLEHNIFKEKARRGRLVQEENIKLRAMREHMFGRYGEYIPVTDAAASRVPSVPLPSSHAEPLETPVSPLAASCFVSGQKLSGAMIMTVDGPKRGGQLEASSSQVGHELDEVPRRNKNDGTLTAFEPRPRPDESDFVS